MKEKKMVMETLQLFVIKIVENVSSLTIPEMAIIAVADTTL